MQPDMSDKIKYSLLLQIYYISPELFLIEVHIIAII